MTERFRETGPVQATGGRRDDRLGGRAVDARDPDRLDVDSAASRSAPCSSTARTRSAFSTRPGDDGRRCDRSVPRGRLIRRPRRRTFDPVAFATRLRSAGLVVPVTHHRLRRRTRGRRDRSARLGVLGGPCHPGASSGGRRPYDRCFASVLPGRRSRRADRRRPRDGRLGLDDGGRGRRPGPFRFDGADPDTIAPLEPVRGASPSRPGPVQPRGASMRPGASLASCESEVRARRSRRMVRTHRRSASLDLRRTARAAVRTDGEPVRRYHRGTRRTPAPDRPAHRRVGLDGALRPGAAPLRQRGPDGTPSGRGVHDRHAPDPGDPGTGESTIPTRRCTGGRPRWTICPVERGWGTTHRGPSTNGGVPAEWPGAPMS